MVWIEPLELQTWLMSVFAGTPEFFTIIALMVIAGIAGFFRMTGLGIFFMIALFLLMFSNLSMTYIQYYSFKKAMGLYSPSQRFLMKLEDAKRIKKELEVLIKENEMV